MLKKRGLNKDLIFYIVMLAFPVLQFCIFYIGVNTRSFAYAFQQIDGDGTIHWTGQTLQQAFTKLTSPTMLKYFGNSFMMYILTYFIGTSLALIFSYFIYKKLPMGGFFKVLLFLPSIISAIVLAIIFMYFAEKAIPSFANTWFGEQIKKGLFSNANTRFGTLVFYNIFVSFGTSVLMYSNAMSGIPEDIIEASKLDGCSRFREFTSIVLPNIFPTISTFAITSLAGVFMNQFCIFSLWGKEADSDVITIGYYLYKETVISAGNETDFPILCAIGFFLTLVAVPVTLFVRFLLEKYGPSEK